MNAAYPLSPGYKEETTSKEAADKTAGRCEFLRVRVLKHLSSVSPSTADECAKALGESMLSIRPRFSELRKLNKIEPSGKRRKNESGHSAVVWKLLLNVKQGELFE